MDMCGLGDYAKGLRDTTRHPTGKSKIRPNEKTAPPHKRSLGGLEGMPVTLLPAHNHVLFDTAALDVDFSVCSLRKCGISADFRKQPCSGVLCRPITGGIHV